ncbi:MAG TPA: hypothetical protein VG387_21400 [Rhizomicrobium sp.]|jgi:hypothetical protein|nr:hypothetical protein [Rhizomicrobium sp.]
MKGARIFLALAAVLALGACGGKPPPTDKAMADGFFAQRKAFETLKDDLCKLKYDQTITRDWAQPQMPLADETRLRERMTALGARSLHYMRGCQLWIEMWSSGIGREASYKKYRFGPPMYRIIEIKEPPKKDLNAYLDKRVAIASFEKNLVGDWWIELDHWQ